MPLIAAGRSILADTAPVVNACNITVSASNAVQKPISVVKFKMPEEIYSMGREPQDKWPKEMLVENAADMAEAHAVQHPAKEGVKRSPEEAAAKLL